MPYHGCTRELAHNGAHILKNPKGAVVFQVVQRLNQRRLMVLMQLVGRETKASSAAGNTFNTHRISGHISIPILLLQRTRTTSPRLVSPHPALIQITTSTGQIGQEGQQRSLRTAQGKD